MNTEKNKSNFALNEDMIKGKWKEMKGDIQKMWGKLTDDDLEQAKGDLTSLSGIIQRHYGESKETVDTKINNYFGSTWNDIKSGIAKTSEKAKHAVEVAADSAKHKM
jgi:uncharacterized protein YjbJ (UPF0337 family)